MPALEGHRVSSREEEPDWAPAGEANLLWGEGGQGGQKGAAGVTETRQRSKVAPGLELGPQTWGAWVQNPGSAGHQLCDLRQDTEPLCA